MSIYLLVLGHWYHHYTRRIMHYKGMVRRFRLKRWGYYFLPFEPVKVKATHLGRSEVPYSSNRDKLFLSRFADNVYEFLDNECENNFITPQQRDNWCAALARQLPDLRLKVKPKRTKEEIQQSLDLLSNSLPKYNGTSSTNRLMAGLRGSLLCTKA